MKAVPLAALALACVCFPALAQVATVGDQATVSSTTVTAPVGSWAITIAQWLNAYIVPTLASIVAGYALTAIAKVYPWAALFLSQRRVEMMIQAGADYGLNAVRGAAKGKALHVNVASEVLAAAVNYLLNDAPPKVIAAAGGAEGIAKRVFRVLNLDEGANAGNVLAPVVQALNGGGR